ncbi:MAG: baeRF10 domain-containing protein [Planctomycetota bacterium]|jgi:peptide chain release factor subunit 1
MMMFGDVDLRKLSEMTAPERAFLTVCLSGPRSVRELDRTFRNLRRVLSSSEPAGDEREHFDENVKLVTDYLDKHPLAGGSLCIFACWALDFLEAVPCPAPLADGVWVDSSPYIRPLAELQEEYENVAVVVADNRRARIFLVSSAVAGDEAVVTGNVKNHVKKGGWSQQRYERRRDKELLLYAREIVNALQQLAKTEDFRRVVLAGGKEVLRIIHENLPADLQDRAATKAVDLGKGEGAVNADIQEAVEQLERRSEQDLWEQIRANYLRGGLGCVGLEACLDAVRMGRAEKIIVDRTFKPVGRRCRDCENLQTEPADACGACGSTSLFDVDVVNEIAELGKQTGCDTDFADPIESLTEAGRIAALLRY